jgi:hypothetical protein
MPLLIQDEAKGTYSIRVENNIQIYYVENNTQKYYVENNAQIYYRPMGSVEHIALGQENIGGQQHCFELMP